MIPDLIAENFMVPCVLMEKVRVPDGEGGWVPTWTEGAEFRASIVMDNTMSARVAEHEGMHAVYTVTTDPTAPLDYHDVFRRVSDGQVFRVTSDGADKVTPGSASFQFSQVSAERWELTDG